MIDRNSCIAMYEQIVNHVRNEILLNKYEIGSSLGTQQEMAQSFGVSLITIRRAMQILEKEGIVEIRQGKGTFVKNTYIPDKLNVFNEGDGEISVAEDAVTSTKALGAKLVSVPHKFSEYICEGLGETPMCFEHVDESHNMVVCYGKLYMPQKYGQLITAREFKSSCIYDLFTNKLHIQLDKSVQRLRALPLGTSLAGIFKSKAGTPVLHIEREIYGKDHNLVGLWELYYDYSRYELQFEVDLSVKYHSAAVEHMII